MATSQRKVYETSFRLSASMSKDYQETFEMARRLAGSLGESFVDVNREAERAAQVQTNAFEMAAAAAAQAGLTQILGELKDAYISVTEASMEFGYQMSAVEAISQANGSEMQKLTAEARELGDTTVFTATESAEAMTFMAQAGWNTQEMLAGMSGVISLAAASGTGLAESSSIVADTLAGFGMQADETGRLVDVMAQAAANSNTNVSLMGETFQNAAAVAGALGFTIEDTSVMLGLMANAGVKGSRAGTTLRNIFNGLAKGVKLTASAFGEVDYSMFKSDGSAKSLSETVEELRGYFSQMTTQEKYLNAEELAGLRGYNGLLAILNATDEQYQELYADINNATGAAERMEKVRLDNLQGDVTLLKSAWVSLNITIGNEFNDNNRGLVQFATRATTAINGLLEKNPDLINFGATLLGMGGAAVGVLTVVTAVTAATKALSLLGLTLSGPVGIAMAAAAAVVAVGALVVELASYTTEAEELIEKHRELVDTYNETISSMYEEYSGAESLIAQLELLAQKEERTEAEKAHLYVVTQKLAEIMPELGVEYDRYTDKLNIAADAVRDLAKAEYIRRAMAEQFDQMGELGMLAAEQEEQVVSLRGEIGMDDASIEKINKELEELRANRSIWEYLNPFSASSRRENELVHERSLLSTGIGQKENQLSILEKDLENTYSELDALESKYNDYQTRYDMLTRGYREPENAEADLVYSTPEAQTVTVDVNNVYNVTSEEVARTIEEANDEIVDVLRGVWD